MSAERAVVKAEQAVCRLFRGKQLVGLGFAVDREHVVTCAHVVNKALQVGDPPQERGLEQADFPDAEVSLEAVFEIGLPAGEEAGRLTARPLRERWGPADPGSFKADDVAVLELSEPVPEFVPQVTPGRAGAGAAVQVYGPVPGRPDGGHVAAEVMGDVAGGRVQLDADGEGFKIRPGFSGGPVWLRASGDVVGMLAACALGDDAVDAYMIGAARIALAWPQWTEPRVELPAAPRRVGRRGVLVAVLAVFALAAGVTVAARAVSGGSPSSGPPVSQTPVPASPSSPPLAVLSVGTFRTASDDGRAVLPGPLTLSPADTAVLNQGTSDTFAAWYASHGGVALNSGYSDITLKGNESQPVRITDMKVIKRCGAPFSGTLLRFYTQGGSQDTYQVGFDLDAPDPVAEEMANTTARGLYPTGQDYFVNHVIVVDPGQVITLSVGGFTKDHSCTFRVRIIETTANGPVWQDVDGGSKPFAITAAAARPGSSGANAGYRIVYVQDANLNWQRTTP